MSTPATYAEKLWDLGQQHLAAGRYVSARAHLESAERILWRARDFAALARIYLPLLETRRQLRHLAVDGYIWISELSSDTRTQDRQGVTLLTEVPAGVMLAGSTSAANQTLIASRKLARPYDALVLIRDRNNLYLAPVVDAHAAAGLRVTRAASAKDYVDPEIRPDMTIPLPEPRSYSPGTAEHAQVRESLLIAWEALALKWQSRHSSPAQPHQELAACRAALCVDPACEPITMRLIDIAEKLSRR